MNYTNKQKSEFIYSLTTNLSLGTWDKYETKSTLFEGIIDEIPMYLQGLREKLDLKAVHYKLKQLNKLDVENDEYVMINDKDLSINYLPSISQIKDDFIDRYPQYADEIDEFCQEFHQMIQKKIKV